MYLLVAVLLALTAVSAANDYISGGLRPHGQSVTGSIHFNYYSTEGEAAADLLVKYLSDLNDQWTKYINSFKTSNNAILTLKKYNDLEQTVLGTKCKAELIVTGAEKTIDTEVKNCGALAPQDDIKDLKNQISQSLIKIQTADNEIQQNSVICTSLRRPQPLSCTESMNRDLKEISSAVSEGEKQKFSSTSKNTFYNLTKYLKSCVDSNTAGLVEQLVGLINRIQDCKKRNNK